MIDWASFKAVGKEREYLADAFASGWVSSGPYVEKLEAKTSKLLGGGTALAVSNGTSALMLAFQTLGVKPGDKVIVPAFSFQAATNALLQLGAEPVFCDVDPLTWNQTRATVDSVLDDSINGVVVVHNYGATAEIGPISELCKSKGVWLIEDAAEAWFSKFNSQYVGQFGDISTFSMHATKTIACGEGGMVLINQKEMVERAKLYRSHGLDRTAIHYKHILAGNNYRLSNLLAAIAFAQLENHRKILNLQANRTARYRELLSTVPGISFQKSFEYAENEYWADAILLDTALTETKRDDVLEEVKRLGADLRPGFYTPNTLGYHCKSKTRNTPVSEYISKNLIVLPCSPMLSNSQIDQIGDFIKSTIMHNKTSSAYSIHTLSVNRDQCQSYLKQFIANLGVNKGNFRYFNTRDTAVVQNHLATILLLKGNEPVGYGHLDQDGDKVWLGIALRPGFTGRKLGNTIMYELLKRAEAMQIKRIDLSVDRDNSNAHSLYLRHGFKEDKGRSTESALHMYCERCL